MSTEEKLRRAFEKRLAPDISIRWGDDCRPWVFPLDDEWGNTGVRLAWLAFKSGHALGVNAERERCAGVVRGKIDLHPLGMDYSANRALDSAASAIEKGESVE